MKQYFTRVFIPAFVATLFFGYAGRSFREYGLVLGDEIDPIFFIPFAIVIVGLPLLLQFRCAFPTIAILYLGILTLLEYFAPHQGWLFEMLCFMTSEMLPFLTVMLWGWIAQHTDIKRGYFYYFPLVIVLLVFSFGFVDYVLPADPSFLTMLICAVLGFLPLVLQEPEVNKACHGLLSPLIVVIFLSLISIFVLLGGITTSSTIAHYYPTNEYHIFMGIFAPYLSLAILAIFPLIGLIAYAFLRWCGWRTVTIASILLFCSVGAFLFFDRSIGAITAAFLSSSLSLMRKVLLFPLIQIMIVHVTAKWRFMTQVIFGWLLLPFFGFLVSIEGGIDFFMSGVLCVATGVAAIAAVYFIKPSRKDLR